MKPQCPSQRDSVRHHLLKKMLRLLVQIIWTLLAGLGQLKSNLIPAVTCCFVKMAILGSCAVSAEGLFLGFGLIHSLAVIAESLTVKHFVL